MLESIAPLLTAIKNAGPKIYAGAFIASLLLLFLPANIIAEMGLTDFRLSNRPVIAAIFIISGSLLAVHIFFGGAPYAKSKLKNWSWRKATREYLTELTNQEKEFLRYYINEGQNTRYASIHDGVANGLVAKSIVYRASNFSVGGVPGNKFAFNLQHYARTYLNNNRGLLD
jgi:hypothetical protein